MGLLKVGAAGGLLAVLAAAAVFLGAPPPPPSTLPPMAPAVHHSNVWLAANEFAECRWRDPPAVHFIRVPKGNATARPAGQTPGVGTHGAHCDTSLPN